MDRLWKTGAARRFSSFARRPSLFARPCAPAAAAFLGACVEGETLGEAALAASARDENFDFGQTLVELTEFGAFVDFTRKR